MLSRGGCALQFAGEIKPDSSRRQEMFGGEITVDKSPASILILRLSSMGDVVHALTVVSDLHIAWPHAAIDWLVEESFAPIVRQHPAVRNVLTVALRRWRRKPFQLSTWQEFWRSLITLRSTAYDMVFDIQGLIKSALLARLARGTSYGAARPRERVAALFYHHRLFPPQNRNACHAVVFFRALSALAINSYSHRALPVPPLTPPCYNLTPPAIDLAVRPHTPYCVIMMFTSKQEKMLPLSSWRQVGHALEAQGLSCVLLAGSQKEREERDRLLREWPTAIAAPVLDLKSVMALLHSSALNIAPDTGIAHLSLALDRPTLAVFLGSNPKSTGVYGATRHINLGEYGKAPATEDIITAALSLLA